MIIKKRFDLPFSFPLINDLIHESIKFRPDYYFIKFLNGEFPKVTLWVHNICGVLHDLAPFVQTPIEEYYFK